MIEPIAGSRPVPVPSPPLRIEAPIEILGISRWKRWQIEPFLAPRCTALHFCGSAAEAWRRQSRHGGGVAVWAAREPEGLAETAVRRGVPLWRIEDGFLRSAGLGSNHVGGASLVIDPRGIYFDPRTPSTLEHRLQTADYAQDLLQRAARLRRQLVETGLTKYNVGSLQPPSLGGAGRQRLLVVGQVENDASIRLGAAEVRSNQGLLEAVRRSAPEAWIVYKPHPDVDAGTRPGRVEDDQALRWADQIVRDVATTALFPACDAVHVISSLAGFEALLHGRAVVAWGRPFYAGWGLTTDRATLPRRTRRRDLDALVAASLIEYPLYADPATGRPCEVEDVVATLARRGPVTAQREASRLRRYGRLLQGALRSIR